MVPFSFVIINRLINIDNTGVKFLGTPGRVITSIKELSRYDSTLEILERTLFWRHMAPTAPDTAYCFPFSKRDPFVLDQCPDVYFAADQDNFDTRLFEGDGGQKVRLISVPNFEKTKMFVMVNLRTLECEVVAFN